MKKQLFSAFFLLFVVVLSGCSTPPQPRIFWPPPPGDTALELVGLYYSEESFDKTGWQNFQDKFLGNRGGDYFQRPTGIAGDGNGKVYVADQLLKNVRIFDFNTRQALMLTMTTSFSRPAGLAIDSQKRLYVVDAGAKQILVFAPDNNLLFAFGGAEFFENPNYIAINERLGRAYVSDGKAHKIVVFDLQGKHLFSFGRRGSAPGEFYSPQGMAIDRDNRVFVADMLNARIQVLDADGAYLRHFGERGDNPGQMEMPSDLAFDSQGHLYLVDIRQAALTVFTAEGEPYFYLGGGKSAKPLAFGNPGFIQIDSSDRVHITDMINLRFVVWQYLSPGYLQANPITEEDLRQTEKIIMRPAQKEEDNAK